jgi:hypothetical protein
LALYSYFLFVFLFLPIPIGRNHGFIAILGVFPGSDTSFHVTTPLRYSDLWAQAEPGGRGGDGGLHGMEKCQPLQLVSHQKWIWIAHDSTRNVYFTRNGLEYLGLAPDILDYLGLAPDILDLHLKWYILDGGSWSEYHGDNEIEVGYQTSKMCFAMPEMEFWLRRFLVLKGPPS